jgi:hypothetical protein
VDYVIPPDNMYGFRDSNGTWNGVVALAATAEVDLGLGLYTHAQERMEVVDYLPPVLKPK